MRLCRRFSVRALRKSWMRRCLAMPSQTFKKRQASSIHAKPQRRLNVTMKTLTCYISASSGLVCRSDLGMPRCCIRVIIVTYTSTHIYYTHKKEHNVHWDIFATITLFMRILSHYIPLWDDATSLCATIRLPIQPGHLIWFTLYGAAFRRDPKNFISQIYVRPLALTKIC